jgi:hypothetical protein
MDGVQYFALALGIALFLLGSAHAAGNWALWKNRASTYRNREEADLLVGRLGRRLHISVILMGLGLAIACGAFLGRNRLTAYYWYGVVALAVWMSILALVDGGATWSYVLRVRRRLAAKRAALLSEVAARSREVHEAGAGQGSEAAEPPKAL